VFKIKKKSIPELDKLFTEIGTYRKSEDFKKLLEFIKKFPTIAPYNAMLLHIQKPGSHYVASAQDWSRKFNRTIKPGARPLVILRPFGPVAFVFELSDTEGEEPFSEKLLNPFGTQGKVSENLFKRLINNIKYDGVSYSEADYGSGCAGRIQVSKRGIDQKIVRGKKKIWLNVLYDLVVNKNHEIGAKFATIAHELGHLYCGHLGAPTKGTWWRARSRLNENEKEFEAESVCWLVCERQGIKNPSADYLSGYLNDNEEIPYISIDTVLKAVGIIESAMQGNKEPRKEIIAKIIDLG
jgi:hypothetical protein